MAEKSKFEKRLDDVSNVLQQAAFGNFGNMFKKKEEADFLSRPIGLLQKSYSFMLDNISRNIGSGDISYDGYGTPIGFVANPNYTIPWFKLDFNKNSVPNYLEYIRNIYGQTSGVVNINNTITMGRFDSEDLYGGVGVIETGYVLDALTNGNGTFSALINPNGFYTDTNVGNVNGYNVSRTLLNATAVNTVRNNTFNKSISRTLTDYYGLTDDNIKKRSFEHQINEKTGRFEDININDISISPVYNSDYGNLYFSGGVYSNYLESLNDLQIDAFLSNIGRNKYQQHINNVNPYMSSGLSFDIKDSRYIFKSDAKHKNISHGKISTYAEKEDGRANIYINYHSFNDGVGHGVYGSFQNLSTNDLLNKTNKAFSDGKMKTIVARFKTGKNEDFENDLTQTAYSKKHGLSHGRNLLKKESDKSEGYDNPYCRVWTYHHQYKSLKDTIRPFEASQDELYSKYGFSAFSANHGDGFENGRRRLAEYGSLNKNGMVNITPVEGKNKEKSVDIRNCMFSIENLAWKDSFSNDSISRNSYQVGGLSKEQKGPFGGRIMWFPPYGLNFTENVSVGWNDTSFIGRGEKIYTYTNTTRSGTLSFKLLVDHPSIINYWKGRGRSVSDSVDDVDDAEQELLRFFAGCDMLTGEDEPVVNVENIAVTPEITSPSTEAFTFGVFYPNNYSGKDDSAAYAIAYLLNGIGTSRIADGSGSTDLNGSLLMTQNTNGYGGYEVRKNKGISYINTQASDNRTIANIQGKGTFVTMEPNDFAETRGLANKNTDKDYDHIYYYRVDKRTLSQKLKKSSYLDTKSECLNSRGGLDKVAKFFSVENNGNLFSLADMYVALNNSDDGNSVLNGLYDEDAVENIIREKILNTKRIKKVTVYGMASSQGNNKSERVNNSRNNDLRYQRAETVIKWLRSYDAFKNAEFENKEGTIDGDKVGDDVNELSNKLYRSAKVVIEVSTEDSKQKAEVEREGVKTDDGSNGGSSITNIIATQYVTGETNNGLFRTNVTDEGSNKNYQSIKPLFNGVRDLVFNLKALSDDGALNVNTVTHNAVGMLNDIRRGASMLGNAFRREPTKSTYVTLEKAKNNNGSNSKSDETWSQNNSNNNIETRQQRYDNEATFFSMLEKEEPFLHHKISDKIKYFDPAFHSISPEGFNARLTFLHQCTRQGPTIAGSDENGRMNTANNLSFGRPPVCILRLGDFYYTKILIESMSIDFDPLVWDLNPEGIGVMPMIANITLGFHFIGGSSLAGHITRLQNAISFNYYANTEVYDNRSELATYDENGDIERLKPNPIL